MTDDLIVEQGADVLSLYQFGSKTAKHWFCSICGIHVHHQRRVNPKEMGVHIGCVEGVDPRIADTVTWSDGVNHPSDTTS